MAHQPKTVLVGLSISLLAIVAVVGLWRTPEVASVKRLESSVTLEEVRTRDHVGGPPVQYKGARVDGLNALMELVCEKEDPGSCDGHVCTVSQKDFSSVPWTKDEESHTSGKEFSFDKDTGMYSTPTARWNDVVDETGELKKLNMLLNDAPDPSLCSNPLCRLGPNYDGGWSVCIDENHLQSRDCVIYSVGISTRPLFSVAAAGLGCQVHMFDHTLEEGARKVMPNLHKNIHFHPLGLSGVSNKDAHLISLPDFMKANNHEFIDVLKIDCEGCEWSVFDSIANLHPQLLDRVGQLLVEVHLSHNSIKTLDPVTHFVDHVFEKHGFRVAYRHLNPYGARVDFRHRVRVRNQEALKNQPPVKDYPFWELVLLRQGGKSPYENQL